MPFDESPAVRRINALCSNPAPARYLHIPTGIHWVVIDSLGMSCSSKTSSDGAD